MSIVKKTIKVSDWENITSQITYNNCSNNGGTRIFYDKSKKIISAYLYIKVLNATDCYIQLPSSILAKGSQYYTLYRNVTNEFSGNISITDNTSKIIITSSTFGTGDYLGSLLIAIA